jgi:CRISPR-associated exonuclease Cas4
MSALLALLLVLCLTAGLTLLLRARALRQASGLPAGQVIYADTGAWQRVEKPLFSPRYRLTGRPDYLVREGDAVIPVEVKPSRDPLRPYDSDVMQLATYCLLVEETHGEAPPYGILKYRQRAFAIPYTSGLRRRVLATLDEMRAGHDARSLPRSHDQPARCASCGVRTYCDQRLGN